MKLLYIDFEYNRTAEPELNLVSAALEVRDGDEVLLQQSYWLQDPSDRLGLYKIILSLIPDYTIVSYALTAEARCLFDLIPSLRPGDFKGIDLYLNYRMLLNHNDELAYGKQLIRGVEKVTKKPKPKYARTEEDSLDDGNKPEYGLAAACYKLLGVKIDTGEKTRMRDIIIAGEALEGHREAILAYGESDIKYLPDLLKSQISAFKELGLDKGEYVPAIRNMADYAIRSAWMERLGYPVRAESLKKFASAIPEILTVAADKVNKSCPEVGAFSLDKKTNLYVKKESPIRAWIKSNHDIERWVKTDSGQPSLSLDAFARYYRNESEGFGGEMLRYLKTKQSLNGFTPNKSKRGSFFDYLGTDGRARPYFGIYGSQSSRSQPSATGYLPLKAHWMRYFIHPESGKAIVGIDYASQEFLVAALLSEDDEMVKAYQSGDVYLAFGKQAGFIPKDGTKQTHKRERDIFKQLVLAVSYDMTAPGLSSRLNAITKEPWTTEKAEELIGSFYEVYSDYADWKKEVKKQYASEGYLSLKDFWTMFGDNDNFRSVGNFPVQGAGAAIMRKSVALAQDSGLDVIYTLHDAIYVEYDSYRIDAVKTLNECMIKGFMNYFKGDKRAAAIRLDAFAWSSDYPRFETRVVDDISVDVGPYYVDERGANDLNSYRRFFL